MSALPRLDLPHQREADWPVPAANAAEKRSLCYLWEDVRRSEKLDSIQNVYAHSLNQLLMIAKARRALRSTTVPNSEVGKIG